MVRSSLTSLLHSKSLNDAAIKLASTLTKHVTDCGLEECQREVPIQFTNIITSLIKTIS